MTEDSQNSNAGDRDEEPAPESLPPLTYIDYREFRRLLRMLDVQQHLNLSAHLYSACLINKLTHGKLPHRAWSAWPLQDAPLPPQTMDDYPDAPLGEVSPKEIDRLRAHASEPFPRPPDPATDAPQVLLRACEEVLRRIVHRRIQSETALNIEALLEPEPQLGGALSQAIVNTVQKYAHRVPPAARRHGLVSWHQLGIEGPARKRLKRLFDRDLSEYDHVDAGGDSGFEESGSDFESLESGSEASGSGSENSESENSGSENSGSENSGSENSGSENSGTEASEVDTQERQGDGEAASRSRGASSSSTTLPRRTESGDASFDAADRGSRSSEENASSSAGER